MEFKISAPFKPTGDQPEAISRLTAGIKKKLKYQTLLGVTGSGKTFTIANVIQNVQKPTLVISHNKTLAAQLFGEFKAFFPENTVEYFVSYYDYYQPEAYVPETDLYIEKDASINEEIERLRLRATSALLTRPDVIIVASVSCIYNIGSPDEVRELVVILEKGIETDRDRLLERLVGIQYQRNDVNLARGNFRVRGDIIELHPSNEEFCVRLRFLDDLIEKLEIFDPVTGRVEQEPDELVVFPAKHFVTTKPKIEGAMQKIEAELQLRVEKFKKQGKLIEAQRILQRTRFDLEMLRELGYCNGIENYSMHLSGRTPAMRPFCLLDYFPKDFLLIIDESHVTIPQIEGMYNGDRARKSTLVEYGFRLPSALENRPLKFNEFESLANYVICMSATPAQYEIKQSQGRIVEQVVRPTGVVDPEVIIRPTESQIEDLIERIREKVNVKERVLVTTLTKRMAEDLADYLNEIGIKVRYLHSEIDAIQRVEILRGLRLGDFDVLVGINLLREGLDLPEVSLVAILDADKEGFLRSERSLIQTAGRAARNVNGSVVLYADNITDSIKRAVAEMARRRQKQIEYNKKHAISPKTITKTAEEVKRATLVADAHIIEVNSEDEVDVSFESIARLKKQLAEAVRTMNFEKAIVLRDRIKTIQEELERKK